MSTRTRSAPRPSGDDVHRPFRLISWDQRPADQAARREGDRRPAARRRGERGLRRPFLYPRLHGTSGSSRCDRSTSGPQVRPRLPGHRLARVPGAERPRRGSRLLRELSRQDRCDVHAGCVVPRVCPGHRGRTLAGPHRVRTRARGRPSHMRCRAHRNTTVFVKVSTGVGAGIVPRGASRSRVWRAGGRDRALVVKADCQLCGCGNRGCLETLASVPAILRPLNRCMDGSTSPRWRASSPPATRQERVRCKTPARPSGRR